MSAGSKLAVTICERGGGNPLRLKVGYLPASLLGKIERVEGDRERAKEAKLGSNR